MVSNILHNPRKVVVVGAGAVGSTFAYALAQSGLAEEIVIIDQNEKLAIGQVLDLSHGKPFFPTVDIRVGEPTDYNSARVIVMTAGAKQQPGESRLELLQRNAAIVKTVVHEIVDSGSSAVLVMVSNPVDILTHVALKVSGWERGRVIGSGTVLDSARLRYFISQYCRLDVHNVHAYVLGEHGDSEFVAWSMAHVGGIPIDQFCALCGECANWDRIKQNIEQQVRDSAYHIIDYKGATSYAVGLALVRITGAILRGQRSVLTVSTFLEGEYGLSDVCLSVPSILAENGVGHIVEGRLTEQEHRALTDSASVLQSSLAELS